MQSKRALNDAFACPACGTPCAPTAKFCSECGHSLQAAGKAPSSPPPAPQEMPNLPLPRGEIHAVSRRSRAAGLISRAERRQLTVMFCDLVGSTELSTRMDPEELGELLGRYRTLVQGEVEALGGTTARFLGDGVLVYFGYPLAREDDAVRAVRAALAIVRGIQALGSQAGGERPGAYPAQGLQVHLGIHTGMVLIDRSQGGVGDIIGETPNLAAKVEELAPPDTILVSSATQALTAEAFAYAPWGPLRLRGSATALDLFRLIGERDRRRDETAGRRAKQFFGRMQETTRLARLWCEAAGQSGAGGAPSGRVASIVGEAGIGKTRLAQWVAEQAEAGGGTVVRFYCAEEASSTAFWPITETIASLCRLNGQTRTAQLHRLRRVALRAGLPADKFVPALADLLWVAEPGEAGAGALIPQAAAPPTAEKRRQLLVELLLGWAASLAAEAPLLLIVENVHWIDPSSQALLADLAQQARQMRMLMLVTSRPAAPPPLAAVPGVERFPLDRLPAQDLEAMLTALWRDAILPSEMQRQLLDRCDGVPLFLEQLVKTVAERVNRGSGAALPDVPTSLRDMLASRLDRLGPAKPVALAASVIGRQFSLRLLRALLPRRATEVETALRRLVQADIIRPVATPAGASGEQTYKFRHALLRDAAYDSLLRSERAKFHRTAAKAYRKHYAPLVEAQPELVARHASAAGDHAEALEYWWKAGLRARARSANREALAHFRAGMADADKIDTPEESRSQAIRFTMAAARAALSAEGFAAPEVERLNNRALALVEADAAPHLLLAALGGIYSFYVVRGPIRQARESAQRMLDIAAADDPAALARNKRRLGWSLFCGGDIRGGTSLLAEALELSQNDVREEAAGLSASDAMLIGQINLGWAESFMGDLHSAVRRCSDALALARRRYDEMASHSHDVGNIPGDLAYALCLSAAVAKQAQQPDRVVALAGEARVFAGAHDLPYWRAWSTVMLGWGTAHEDAEAGVALLREGIEGYVATGARLFVPYNLALLAEAHMAYGRTTDGLACVADALAAAAEIEAHFMDAELLRIQARLKAQGGDTEAALATLAQAIDLGERHGATTIRQWAERDRRFLIDGTRGPPGLLLAATAGPVRRTVGVGNG